MQPTPIQAPNDAKESGEKKRFGMNPTSMSSWLSGNSQPDSFFSQIWKGLMKVGFLEEDSPEERARKAVLTLMACLSILVGLVLSAYDFLTGFPTGAIIPFLYSIISLTGLVHFYFSRKYRAFRFILLGSLLLFPFLAMWVRGGFAHSGASMIWALGAPVFAVLFHGPERSFRWFAAYVILLFVSVLIDPHCAEYAISANVLTSSWFFLVHIGGISFCLFILIQFFVARLGEEQAKSESLLLNILPRKVAGRLKDSSSTIADGFLEATILFADLAGFTKLSSTLAPKEVVHLLNEVFSAFDQLAEKHALEKVKTIGDAYMVVGGLPEPRADHPDSIARMALEMREAVSTLNSRNGWSLSLRIGINTGPVVAGVIGLKKFIYDLWGDAVNIASRMESTGIENEIQVSRSTYDRLQEKGFVFAPRGMVTVKGKGEMETFFLRGTVQAD